MDLVAASMVSEVDIWRAATLLLRRYGADAGEEAARRADETTHQTGYVGLVVSNPPHVFFALATVSDRTNNTLRGCHGDNSNSLPYARASNVSEVSAPPSASSKKAALFKLNDGHLLEV